MGCGLEVGGSEGPVVSTVKLNFTRKKQARSFVL